MTVLYSSTELLAIMMVVFISHVSAFAIPAGGVTQATRSVSTQQIPRCTTALSAGEEAGEEGSEQQPMDLNLEQMFEVFEAADKEIPDAEGDKRKSNEASSKGGTDIGDKIGDMISNVFGGGKGQ